MTLYCDKYTVTFRLIVSFQEDVVTLTGQPEVSNTPDPSSRPETNGGARTDSGTAAVQKLAPLNVTHRPAAITAEREKGDNENSRAIQPGDPYSSLPCSENAVAATASSSTTGIATGQRNDEDVFPSNETAKPAGAIQRQHGGKDGETQRQAGHEDSGPPSASTGTPSDAALGSSSSSPQRRAGHEDSSALSGALLGSSSSPPGGAAPPGGAEGEAGASSQSSQPGPDADDTQDLSQRSNPPARPKRSRRVAAKKWNTAGDLEQAEVQPNRFVFLSVPSCGFWQNALWFTFRSSLINRLSLCCAGDLMMMMWGLTYVLRCQADILLIRV